MATGGDDFERLSGAVVLSRLSDSSEEKDDLWDFSILEWMQVS